MRLFDCKMSVFIAFQNIRKWRSNYRVWILFILVIIFTHSYTSIISDFAITLGMKSSPWIFPFLYTDRYSRILFLLPLIFIYCDAPFIDNNQVYIILRSKRGPWIRGQLLYIMFTSTLYFSFVMLATILVNIKEVVFMKEWGKVLGTISSSGMSLIEGASVGISQYIITYFTPFQAMFHTWMLSVLCGIFLGVMIFLFNILLKTKVIGILVASFFIILGGVMRTAETKWFSPVSWVSLNNLDVGGFSQLPTITYVLSVYIISILVMSFIIIELNRLRRWLFFQFPNISFKM